jgi:ribosomal protein L22
MMAERKKTEQKAGGSKPKAAEEKGSAPAKGKAAAKPKTKPKAASTKGKSTSAAKATSKTADTKAAAKSASKTAAKAPAKGKTTAKRKAAAPKKEVERPVVNARARYVRVAPRKARLIADQVRGMPLEDAETLLRFSPRSAAQDIRKLLESAASNAENNHDLVADDLVIKDIRVDEGPTLRRYRPRALGRATKINKRTSHIQVALTPED